MGDPSFERTRMLLGQHSLDVLKNSKVAVFGIGGVGGYAVEALARGGVGEFLLVDHDTVSVSNINRQIIATHKTLGQYKVDVMKQRIMDINPEASVDARACFFDAKNQDDFLLQAYDYIVDAIDTVTSKLLLIARAKECNIPMISSMGTGNKLDPTQFEVADISKTSVCPLARVMRRELKNRGIASLKVVYSKEQPLTPESPVDNGDEIGAKRIPGSVSFVPPAAGLILAGQVILDILAKEKGEI